LLTNPCWQLTASQALITATFSLVQQMVNFRVLPALSMIYTSETIQGQVYIPSVNWIRAFFSSTLLVPLLILFAVMIACVVVVGAFQNLAAMTNAYGFAVATVMFVTTVLIALQTRYVKGKPWLFAVAFFIFFAFFDGVFWGAAIRKVPHGAWVPLVIGLVLCVHPATLRVSHD
jgi:KUP system potassium uptake protein